MICTEATKARQNKAAGKAVKHLSMQTAIKTHLSQPTGVGAFDGQQGISSIVASAVADADMSSIVADIDASGMEPAMAGRANGARTRLAVMKIASSRRMVI